MKLTAKETQKWVDGRMFEMEITQQELADKAGLTSADISRYKKQKAEARIENIERLAQAFNIDLVTMMIVLGLVDPDAKAVPRLVEGKKNSKVIWEV